MSAYSKQTNPSQIWFGVKDAAAYSALPSKGAVINDNRSYGEWFSFCEAASILGPKWKFRVKRLLGLKGLEERDIGFGPEYRKLPLGQLSP